MTRTIDDIRTANRVRGFHFFSPDSMRFFRTRVGERVYQGPGGVYFVTSEQFVSPGYIDPRKYTVRRFNPDTGNVGTVGEFNALSRAAAHRRAEKLAQEEG